MTSIRLIRPTRRSALSPAFASALCSVALASPAGTQASDDSSAVASASVEVTNVTARGACKAALRETSGGDQVSVSFDEYALSVDASTAAASARCSLTLDVKLPAGQEYALTGLNTLGSIKLEPGVTASVRSAFHFQGGADVGEQVTTIAGPVDRLFSTYGSFAERGESFLCDSARKLVLDLSLVLDNHDTAATGTVALNELGPLQFAVRPCTTH